MHAQSSLFPCDQNVDRRIYICTGDSPDGERGDMMYAPERKDYFEHAIEKAIRQERESCGVQK